MSAEKEEPILPRYVAAYEGMVATLAGLMLDELTAEQIVDRLAVDLPFHLTDDALEDLRAELNAQRAYRQSFEARRHAAELEKAA